MKKFIKLSFYEIELVSEPGNIVSTVMERLLYVGLLSPDKKELPFERRPVTFGLARNGHAYSKTAFDIGKAPPSYTIAYIALYENIDSTEYLLCAGIA